MTKANPYATCRQCSATFLKPKKGSTHCTLWCALAAKVDAGAADECWEWAHAVNSAGYGVISFNGKNYRAARVILESKIGRPLGRLVTRHKCDNPKCVNPLHLEPGTVSDNAKDCMLRGPYSPPPIGIGSANGRAVLSEAAVAAIRRGGDTAYWAAKYGVARSTINRARRGAGWAHIKA